MKFVLALVMAAFGQDVFLSNRAVPSPGDSVESAPDDIVECMNLCLSNHSAYDSCVHTCDPPTTPVPPMPATAETPMCALPGENTVPSPCRANAPSGMNKKFESGLDRREYTVHRVLSVPHQCQSPGPDPYSCSEFAADLGGGAEEVWQYQCGMCTHNTWHGDHAVFCSEDGSSMYVVWYQDMHSDDENTVRNCSAPVSFTQEFPVLPKASALETHNYTYDAHSFVRDFQPYCDISPSAGCGALPAPCVSVNESYRSHEWYCDQTSESCQRDFEEKGLCHGEEVIWRSGRHDVALPCCQPAWPDQIHLSLVWSEITAMAPLEMSPGPPR